MSDSFYRAFEDKFRGSRDLIKSRLRVYLPFIQPLLGLYKDAKAIDLGCGRGEWLEVIQEAGFDALGVDLDAGMLAACNELGLNVTLADAIETLKNTPDKSIAVISGFHIAEHIEFSDLQSLVQEALRVLQPAGLLILETPNPENIVVGSSSFYLDPTHQRPIPPMLLWFLPEYLGFARTKLVRLQETVELSSVNHPTLKNVLDDLSKDYAVVAQKNSVQSNLDLFESIFGTDFGVSFDHIVNKYDLLIQSESQWVKDRLSEVDAGVQRAQARSQENEALARKAEAMAQRAEAKALESEATAWRAEVKSNESEAVAFRAEAKALENEATAWRAEVKSNESEAIAHRAEDLAISSDAKATLAQTKAVEAIDRSITATNESKQALERIDNLTAQYNQAIERLIQTEARLDQVSDLAQTAISTLHAVQHSTSWRITAPLRRVGLVVKKARQFRIKPTIKLGLRHVANYVNRRPKLRSLTLAILKVFPSVELRIRRAVATNTVLSLPEHEVLRQPGGNNSSPPPPELPCAPPRVVHIYQELKRTLEKREN